VHNSTFILLCVYLSFCAGMSATFLLLLHCFVPSLSPLWFIVFYCGCGFVVGQCSGLVVCCLQYLCITMPWCFLVFCCCVLPTISSPNSSLVFSQVCACSTCNIFAYLFLGVLLSLCVFCLQCLCLTLLRLGNDDMKKKEILPLTLVVCFVFCIVGLLERWLC
jgi:hypothetical protein